MDNGTILRTVFAVVVAINQALSMSEIPDFGNEKANFIYKVVSFIFSILALAINTWYNNDYTEEASYYTSLMRQAKAEEEDGYEGERFFDDLYADDEEEDDE